MSRYIPRKLIVLLVIVVAVIVEGGFKPADLKTFADKYKLPAPPA